MTKSFIKQCNIKNNLYKMAMKKQISWQTCTTFLNKVTRLIRLHKRNNFLKYIQNHKKDSAAV
jgi:hypothetical protein